MSLGTYTSERIDKEFLAAAEKAGWPEVPGIQDREFINSVGKNQRYISTEGKRQDAATCHLRPRLNSDKYPNLHVLVESQVVRVLIDDETKTATGVELRTSPRYNPDAAGEPLRVVKARKLVAASSGACGTPSLLERSGLGDPKVLGRAGIAVIVDLPGVGNGYEDHRLVCDIYHLLFIPPSIMTTPMLTTNATARLSIPQQHGGDRYARRGCLRSLG